MNDLAGAHAMSIAGIMRMAEVMRPNVQKAPSRDSMLFVGHGDPNARGFSYQRWPLRTLLKRLDQEGPVCCEAPGGAHVGQLHQQDANPARPCSKSRWSMSSWRKTRLGEHNVG
jgi:hypothetical protein